jgi:hypothetical protein
MTLFNPAALALTPALVTALPFGVSEPVTAQAILPDPTLTPRGRANDQRGGDMRAWDEKRAALVARA